MRILVIEDQPKLAAILADALKGNGFIADLAGTLEDASDFAAVTRYDAILLDRGLPDGDGLDWLRVLRKRGDISPVLFMSAERPDIDDRVAGLDAGADDYIVKPFEIAELLARLRAVLRRPSSALDPILSAGNLQFDPASRQVWVDGAEIHMPRREACLLEVLIRRYGRVVPKPSLEESLYGFDDEVSPNAIEVGVYRLRTHLQNANASVQVRTARGLGYALEAAKIAASGRRKVLDKK
jgi:DNA-binding response OmpR family regulator